MIEPITDLPDNVLGFRAKGIVTAGDYESIVIPAAEALFAVQGKVRLLYELGDEFSGFEVSAILDDAKLGLKHFTGWERVALVSDVEWIRGAIKAFGLLMPGQVRVFHNREFGEARRWIGE